MVTGFHRGWLFCARRVAAIRLCLGTAESRRLFGAITFTASSGDRVNPIRSRSLSLAVECWAEAHSHTAAPLTVSGLEDWGLVGSEYRASTLLELFITCVASSISRAFMARSAADGLQATRAEVLYWMLNASGVYLRLVGVRRGLSLTMGADGVRIEFEP